LFEKIKNFFTREKCERIIKYDGRTFNLEKLDIPVVPFSIDSIQTEIQKIRDASETAAILDQYQYQMCKICQGLGKEDEEWKKYNKLRIAAIHLITTFRLSLESFKTDPEHNRDRIDDILRRLETIHEIDKQVLPNLDYIISKTDKGEFVSKGDTLPVNPQKVSQAIHEAEMYEDEVDRLIDELKEETKS
jgi:hypothetical protein